MLNLGKIATGTIAIILAIVVSFLASPVLSNIGLNPVVAKFEVGTTGLIVCLVAVSSALLYTYANCRAWQLLASLGILLVPVFVYCREQGTRVQGAGLVLAILTAVPWVAGLALGALARHLARKETGQSL